MILAVVLLPRELLRRPMLGIGSPRAHAFLVLELDDSHPLAVIGEEALMRDVAWHRPGEFVHPIGQRDVFIADARAQAGAKHGHDHGDAPQCEAIGSSGAKRRPGHVRRFSMALSPAASGRCASSYCVALSGTLPSSAS